MDNTLEVVRFTSPKDLAVERRTGQGVANGYAPARVRRRLRVSAVNILLVQCSLQADKAQTIFCFTGVNPV